MDEPTQTQEPDSPPSSEPQLGEEPQSPPPPRDLRGADLRYQADSDVPDWAKGKTADEILAIAETMRANLVTQTPQQPAPTQRKPVSPSIDPDLIYNDAAAYTQQMAGYVDSSVQKQLQATSAAVLAPMASLARDTASKDPAMAEVWNKYGPEIDMTMTNVPIQNRADVAMWRQAAELVAGKHYKELARSEAERLRSTADAGMLSTSGTVGSPSVSLDAIEQLFRDNDPSIQAFKKIGKTASAVRQHAALMGHTPAAYAEMLKNKRTLTYSEPQNA